MIRTVRSHCY